MPVDRVGAEAFDDAGVARAYAYRPPYPPALFDFLVQLPAQRHRALDLGCGPGKIAHNLSPYFEHVDAVDPSLPMLRLADDGQHPNITWIHSPAETAPLAASYDLVTAGASIHWMEHAALFPRLASALAESGFIAVIEGDEAHEAPWQADWEAFIQRWLNRLGRDYDPGGYHDSMTAYQCWIAVAGQRTFQMPVTQSIDEFIECQHSRATWSRRNLGAERAARFDAELRELLLPHSIEGAVRFTVETRLVWGTPG